MVQIQQQYSFVKASIQEIRIKEYSSGKVYKVSYPGQVITVNEERLIIEVDVKNTGTVSGGIVCNVNGQQKSTIVDPNEIATFKYQIEVQNSMNISVLVGHMEVGVI